MSQDHVGIGPGNNTVQTEIRMYKCAGTITKGWGVGIVDAAAVAALVSTYGTGSFIDGNTIAGSDVDANNPTLTLVIGFAKESGTVGEWIEVVVAGFCDYIITDNSVEAGDYLIATTAEGVVGGTAGEGGAGSVVEAMALQDDSGTTLTAAIVFSNV